MEYGAGGGSGGGGGAGSGSDDHHRHGHRYHHDEEGPTDPNRIRKKRYHRHTAHQIQKLETMFKDFPHPDEKQRLQLSRELGLAPRQIKFWFQNRRTQMKAQHERADNCGLRAENDRIRCENIAIREALKNVICPTCGGPPPPVGEDSYFDEHKLRIENAHLKEELDRVSSIAAKYIGRPISQLTPVHPIQISSMLDLSMATSSFGGMSSGAGPSLDLDLDLLPGCSSTNPSALNLPSFHQPFVSLTEMDKTRMAHVAEKALEEFIMLLHDNKPPLWTKSSTNDGKDVLDLDNYERLFQKADNNHPKNPNIRIEASRDSGVVIMNALALVDMFMDSNKWVELFPTIVSKARTLEHLGSPTGSLQLMYEELQVLSPLVPTRQFFLLRFCTQIEQGSWAIVNTSYDLPPDQIQSSTNLQSPHCHKLPSGCLIQDMPNGYSKVTWVEHVEIEDKTPTHELFRDVVHSGMAYGAERWLSTLQRMCERLACLMVTGNSMRDLGGVIPAPDGKRSMMKLAQRMVNSFCASINPCNGHQWTTQFGINNEVEVHSSLRKSTDRGEPPGVFVSAAATICLPVSPQNLFNFFRDEKTRPQWDVLFSGNGVQEVAHIANGSHPGNCISVLKGFNTSPNTNMLILQETCIDSSGSLVVYCPVDLGAIQRAMSGDDPSYIPLLPSGFAILPDATHHHHREDSEIIANASCSTSSTTGKGGSSGSLVTVAFQILLSHQPCAAANYKMMFNQESVATVNNLIATTVQQIKAALNCLPTTTTTTNITTSAASL